MSIDMIQTILKPHLNPTTTTSIIYLLKDLICNQANSSKLQVKSHSVNSVLESLSRILVISIEDNSPSLPHFNVVFL